MTELNSFLSKIFTSQYYKNIDKSCFDPSEVLQSFIKPVAFDCYRKKSYNNKKSEKGDSVDRIMEFLVKEELRNTRKIRDMDILQGGIEEYYEDKS